jgi:Serine protease inhibitor
LGTDISLGELNKYLYSYLNTLPNSEKGKFHFANSIWIKDDNLGIRDSFLQVNKDYYNAEIYQVAFDDTTVEEVNTWVNRNTDGMIPELVENLEPETVMLLINAIAFEAKWAVPYTTENIKKDVEFTTINGSKEKVEMMHSEEVIYLENDKVTGFMKPYANDDYYFVALLPKEEVDISTYITQISGQEITDLFSNKETTEVSVLIPKFSYSFGIKLNDVLVAMGVSDAFSADKADFSKMVDTADHDFYISEVVHKTFISVDEVGTMAGAVTGVIMETTSAPVDQKVVILNRPFIYMIVDKDTNLPIFIGVVTSIQP